MTQYRIEGLPEAFAGEVRATMRSPEYGHPAVREVARGTGPCRVCLRRFAVGEDERILFTYRPRGDAGNVGAPGPIFIHAADCAQYRGSTFPPDLHSLPVILEARAADGRVPAAVRVQGSDADAAIERLLASADVEYVHIRHGEAGCHIARANRAGATSM